MSRARARELALPTFLVLLILIGTAAAAAALQSIESKHARELVKQRERRAGLSVDAAFREPLERLDSVARGIEAGARTDRRSFAMLAAGVLRRPEVEAVGYIERVTEAQRPAFERAHGPIVVSSPTGEPAPPRPVHYVVAGVASRNGGKPGTDLAAEPSRVEALQRAAAAGRTLLTPPLALFGKSAQGSQQVIAYLPIRSDPPGGRFVSAPLTFDRVTASLRRTMPPGTAAIIDDAGVPLVTIGRLGHPTGTRTLSLGGRHLRVRTRVRPGAGTAWDELVLIVGLLVAAGVGAFAGMTRRRERLVNLEVGKRMAERDAAAADLDRERSFSSQLISALPDGFVAADNTGIIVVNDALCELTGYARTELMGRLFPHGFWPEDSLLEVQRLRDHVAEKGAAQMELTLRTKDDRRIPVLVSASRVEGRHGPVEICLISDHRERAEATRILTESEAQMRSLANAATDMVVQLSRAERIEWVSPSAEPVLGYEPDELLGLRLSDLFAEEGLGKLRAEAGVYRVQRKDGLLIWAETTVTPTIDSGGALTGMRTSIRDVTEREEARAALQRAHARYRRMAELLPDTIVFMADADRRFVLAAGGGLDPTEWTSAQIEGHTVDELLASPAQQTLMPYWDAAFAGRGGEIRHTSDAGREYVTRFLPLTDHEGRPDGAMVVATDVTELRRLQARSADGVTMG